MVWGCIDPVKRIEVSQQLVRVGAYGCVGLCSTLHGMKGGGGPRSDPRRSDRPNWVRGGCGSALVIGLRCRFNGECLAEGGGVVSVSAWELVRWSGMCKRDVVRKNFDCNTD